MSIDMYCDACEKLIDSHVSGGVRVKTGKREIVFHLCGPCQERYRKTTKEFIKGRPWKEAL